MGTGRRQISERNGVYQGNIVKSFFKPGEDENWAYDKCEGDERGKPVLGLALIKGMHRNGNFSLSPNSMALSRQI